MEATKKSGEQTAQAWYEANADRFQDAAAIEQAFIGMPLEQQQRLNRFKLWAVDHGGFVSFKDKHVLEFGAGHGRLALEYCDFASYTGVDYSRNLVELGLKRFAQAGLTDRARLIASDCLRYDGPAEGFDVVCSLGMFSSMHHPEEALRKMVYHLRPGGSLFIDFHHSSPIYDPIRRLKWKIAPPTGGVTTAYSGETIRRMFSAAGLANTRIIVREYPFLGKWYARRGWDRALAWRNWLASHPTFNAFGTDAFGFGVKPR